MIEVDQYKEYTEDEINLGRAVSLLVSALWNKDGTLKDFADKEGRAALTKAIGNVPKEIPANLREEDKKLLRTAIQECQKTRKMMKAWWWWIVGLMFIASGMISLCAVMLIK